MHAHMGTNRNNRGGTGMPGGSSSLQLHQGVYVICITMNSTDPLSPPPVVHCCKVYNFDSNSTKATGLRLEGGLEMVDWGQMES